ncbi:hypothetical protein WG947_10715 [Pontibacter sp. H259]|uniref:hypothetical protein n=1 Tax=Pontibacter sp. H259 TaxID=3133421 RepID=UPI0030BC4EE6
MQEFDELKHIWQQSAPAPVANRLPDVNRASSQTKKKLQNELRNGAICLYFTAIVIAAMAIWGNFNFEHWYTYGAMVLICLICLAQATLMAYTYQKVKQIDETASPKQHLSQWEAYYAFRRGQLKWNGPVYFVMLNLALGIYFIEVMAGASEQFLIIFWTIYTAWMIFAYFIMGRRILKREKKRIESIMNELQHLEQQFAE